MTDVDPPTVLDDLDPNMAVTYVCGLCGQVTGEMVLCNSGLHVGPEGGLIGRPIRTDLLVRDLAEMRTDRDRALDERDQARGREADYGAILFDLHKRRVVTSADPIWGYIDAAVDGLPQPTYSPDPTSRCLAILRDERSFYDEGGEGWKILTDAIKRIEEPHTTTRLPSVVTELRELLAEFVAHESGPCRLDHHGYCQDHGRFDEGECKVVVARRALGRKPGQSDWPPVGE